MQHPNVVATAVGRYRIRKRDSWPAKTSLGKVHADTREDFRIEKCETTVARYSCVFVSWEDAADLGKDA